MNSELCCDVVQEEGMLIHSKSLGVTYPTLCHTLRLWIVKEKYAFHLL